MRLNSSGIHLDDSGCILHVVSGAEKTAACRLCVNVDQKPTSCYIALLDRYHTARLHVVIRSV